MKRTKILYWIFTGSFAALMLFSSIPDIIMDPKAIVFMEHLGYPHYFIPFIGVAKVLGVIAILIPGFPRIKEWAYAGLVFDLLGATYSQIAVGDPWYFMLLPLMLAACSYIWFHKKVKLTPIARTINY